MGFWQQLKQITQTPAPQLGSRFLLKGQCPCCQRQTPTTLCSACERQLKSEFLPELTLAQWQTCEQKLPVVALGQYQGQLKRVIAALKYHNQTQLGPLLGEWLARRWLSNPVNRMIGRPLQRKNLAVVPIPLHRDKQQLRGFNQAELIGRGFCRYTNLPLLPHGLIRHQLTAPQFGLTIEARQQNLKNAFQAGHQLQAICSSKHSILLIVDIYTTGATVIAAQQTLQNEGFVVCGVVTVAITPKWAFAEG
jgi:ComF family protein